MTEADWLAIEDPRLLLGWLTGDPPAGHAADLRLLGHCPVKLSDRKLRLWVEACRAAGAAHDHVEHLGNPAGLSVAVGYWGSQDGERQVPMAKRAALLREVVGNPFRPAVLAWREGIPYAETFARPCPWLTPAVVSLAQAAYDECLPDGTLDPARLGILSDALEEAGCAERAVLEHLRGWRPYPVDGWLRDASSTTHVRGCWAVDLILGRN